jgi:aminopeptidase N
MEEFEEDAARISPHVRRFLKWEVDRYLRARGGELIEELLLACVENQGYIHYRKGTLKMFWLKEAVGEAAVNRALRRLIEACAFKAAPHPDTRDVLRLLREEAGPEHKQLIEDLFERITLHDVKVTDSASKRRADGRFDVTLTVEARKLYADGKGRETEAPLDEPFEVGVFTAEPGKKDFGKASVLPFERRPITSSRQTIALTVDAEPKFAGVDPYNKRIDRNSDDNVKRLQ